VAGTGGAAGTGAGGSSTPRTWHGAVGVGGPATSIQRWPSVAVDSMGNAVVVYNFGNDIWSNRYDATLNAWGTPAAIDTRGLEQSAQVTVDKNGIYLAVWSIDNDTSSPTRDGIWQATSSDGIHWSTVSAITHTNAWGAALSENADGAAVVAWTESANANGTVWQVSASIRSTSGSWSAPVVMLAGDGNADLNPSAAISGTGNAFVAWEQGDGTTTDQLSVWERSYINGAWGTAALFESNTAGPAYSSAVAANKAGSAIITYLQVNGSMQLMSRRYTPSSGFAAPLLVAQGSTIDNLYPPSVALDEAGIATSAWNFQLTSGKFNVYTNRSAASDTAWPALPTAMESDDIAANDDPNSTLGQSTMPLVRSDPAGNVVLVWRKRTSGTRFDLVSRYFPAGGTWGAQQALESTTDTDSVFFPALAVGSDGTAVVTWYYGTGLTVWANVFR
jgi:hypothetical protein